MPRRIGTAFTGKTACRSRSGDLEVSPLGRKDKQEPVSARALVLSPVAAYGTQTMFHPVLLIELPDGSTTVGHPAWGTAYTLYSGVIGTGTWLPVTLPPGEPDSVQLDEHHVPDARVVAEVMAEALGGPAVAVVTPDQWRISLALAYAERIIADGAITSDQAEAIRQRIRLGV